MPVDLTAETACATVARFDASAVVSGVRVLAVFDQIGELREKITGIVRTGRGFGMILHAEDRQLAMPHSFDRSVVQIDVRDFDFLRQRFGIDRKTVILRSDRYFPAAQIFHRLIAAAMPEFQFESAAAKREAEHLMPETNAEDRFLPHQTANGFMRVGQGGRIARAVGKKNSVRI